MYNLVWKKYSCYVCTSPILLLENCLLHLKMLFMFPIISRINFYVYKFNFTQASLRSLWSYSYKKKIRYGRKRNLFHNQFIYISGEHADFKSIYIYWIFLSYRKWWHINNLPVISGVGFGAGGGGPPGAGYVKCVVVVVELLFEVEHLQID